MASFKSTRLLIVSDTHGDEVCTGLTMPIDVVIHCGDLTEESKLEEFRTTIRTLTKLNAPLKLVIAGNHDFTLDTPIFKQKLKELSSPDDDLVESIYGKFGEARRLFDFEDAKAAGIVFLDEGTHCFELANGAVLTVFASPYTASVNEWAFQYDPRDDHKWVIGDGVDLVMTHSPPKGVLDYTDSRERAGSSSLFAAVAKGKPLLHCFGHIHEAWGAKMISWRSDIGESPTHFTAIDNDKSRTIETLAAIRPRKRDSPSRELEKAEKRAAHEQKGYCYAGSFMRRGEETLFVNAAAQETDEHVRQLPWMADISLPMRNPETAGTGEPAATSLKRKRNDVLEQFDKHVRRE
nr:putative rhamnogalacturonate lyase c [Quercus suber]